MTKLIVFGRCFGKTTLKKELAACYREKEEDQAIIETLKEKCVDLMQEIADFKENVMKRTS